MQNRFLPPYQQVAEVMTICKAFSQLAASAGRLIIPERIHENNMRLHFKVFCNSIIL